MSVTTERPSIIRAGSGHARCFMCGGRNPRSLGLCFRAEDADTVCAEFQAYPALQGYDGILHGGVIAALLDAAMTHCLFNRGIQALTGDLRVRFLRPVPSKSLLNLRACMLSVTPPLYRVKAELVCDRQVMAWAEAKFMQRRAPSTDPNSLNNCKT